MTNSKSSFLAKRSWRRRFVQSMRRCIGLERLEGRTVFASDFGVHLESQLFASTVTESQPIAMIQAISELQGRSESEPGLSIDETSESNRLFEVVSSPVSLISGDVIVIEVPKSAFKDLHVHGQYLLTYSYAQNYFSDAVNLSVLAIENDLRAQGQFDDFSNGFLESDVGGMRFFEAGSLSSGLVSSTHSSQLMSSESALVLASLTATTDFDAMIRVFDNPRFDSSDRSGQPRLLSGQLANEIRIEPDMTRATVLPDPGPTITRTIIVIRQPEGLILREEPAKQPELTELAVSNSSVGPRTAPRLAQNSNPSSVTKTGRPNVTISTIDIFQVRRSEVARPWLRSTVIPNPARQLDFGFEKMSPSVASSSIALPPSQSAVESKQERNTKWDTRVSATRLQPVEFLLTTRDLKIEKTANAEKKPVIATDVAMSSYSADRGVDVVADEFFSDPISANGLRASVGPGCSVGSGNYGVSQESGSEAWLMAVVSEMQRLGQYPRVATNRESWKNLVRSASQSTAGQALLATVSTIASQQRELNAFGSKSAWEFVIRPAKSS